MNNYKNSQVIKNISSCISTDLHLFLRHPVRFPTFNDMINPAEDFGCQFNDELSVVTSFSFIVILHEVRVFLSGNPGSFNQIASQQIFASCGNALGITLGSGAVQ